MQELILRAKELLESGQVVRVLGWRKGEHTYDPEPAFFTNADALKDFVYNGFCGANLSKYMIEASLLEGKTLVFLKPCDTYSFNQLLTEHRFNRELVYAIGVPCNGMLDIEAVKKSADSVSSVTVDGETVQIETLYDGVISAPRADLLLERCRNCKSKKHVAYDELLGESGEVIESARFDEVEKLEKMTAEERFAFWQNELSRCIRCNACRDACPACTCEKCVFDNPESGMENKAASNEFEEKLFHVIRAFHVVGRCTDCGECSRVCPQQIPLHLLNRKFIKDIDNFYGEYQAGAEVGSRAPIVNYTLDDLEPGEAVERGNENA